jgi:hypothetical protein
MRFLLVILSVTTFASAGCGRKPTLAVRIQNAGGETALRRECKDIFDMHQKTQKEIWMAKDSALPPTIAGLKPQVVRVTTYGGIPMVDVQVSGGFLHHGLMVALTNVPPDLLPRRSTWRVTKIGQGIFEYRE